MTLWTIYFGLICAPNTNNPRVFSPTLSFICHLVLLSWSYGNWVIFLLFISLFFNQYIFLHYPLTWLQTINLHIWVLLPKTRAKTCHIYELGRPETIPLYDFVTLCFDSLATSVGALTLALTSMVPLRARITVTCSVAATQERDFCHAAEDSSTASTWTTNKSIYSYLYYYYHTNYPTWSTTE